ncbi:MAG TPA: nucleotidyltransferase [Kiritimatiellia bacterium]|nr:nucleotidyltransferase [Kiritimatiellia bacterium]
MKPTLVIMAAGMGSRYGGLKQIDPVGPSGEIMLDYSVYDALQAGFGRVVFIIRRDIEAPFREVIDRNIARAIPVSYAFQALDDLPSGFSPPEGRTKPWGTGHAILSARAVVNEPFAVINADDFYGRAAYQGLARVLSAAPVGGTEFYLAGYKVSDTLSDHGAVSRGVCEVGVNDLLQRVVERLHIEKQGGRIVAKEDGQLLPIEPDTTVSMNFWGFTPALFPHLERAFVEFLKQRGAEAKSELAIPTIVDQLIAEGAATVRVVPASARWLGMTYPEDKPLVRAGIQALIDAGVYPDPLWA